MYRMLNKSYISFEPKVLNASITVIFGLFYDLRKMFE